MRTGNALGLLLMMSGAGLSSFSHAHEDPAYHSRIGVGLHSEVLITIDGEYRRITSNGIPDHAPGHFPNRGNPNTISEQSHSYRVPLHPRVSVITTALGMHPFGVALNGVPFDPGAAEFWKNDPRSGWQYEALSGKIDLGLDASNAHVQPGGAYHYHGPPAGLIGAEDTGAHSKLIGYAADGFPIYSFFGFSSAMDSTSGIKKLRSSYRIRAGERVSGPGGAYDGTFIQDHEYVVASGNLDECNGRIAVTPEYPSGTYLYVLTPEYPFIPRCFRGTIDSSFLRHGTGGSGSGGNPGKTGPLMRPRGERRAPLRRR